MAMTLAGYTIPTPSLYEVERGLRGVTYGLADGSMQIDVVDASPHDIFTIGYKALTPSEFSNLLSGYFACVTAQTLVDFESVSHQVTLAEGLPPAKWRRVNNAGTPRYEITIQLRGV